MAIISHYPIEFGGLANYVKKAEAASIVSATKKSLNNLFLAVYDPAHLIGRAMQLSAVIFFLCILNKELPVSST